MKAFKEFIVKHSLLKPKEKLLVGVSGGPDSVCLLYLLNGIKNDLSLKIYVAHLDHKLRPDSAADRVFVEKLARKLGLKVFCAGINLNKLKKNTSIEEMARNARLSFLFKIAKKLRVTKIALGHNFDDQAETILMRIIRGTGMFGLSGILPSRKFGNFTIIRPLLGIRRSQIEMFLKRRKIRYRLDESNFRDIYMRNKLRNKLLPFLEKGYNPNIKEVLANMAESISYDYDFLLEKANILNMRMKKKISLKGFSGLHPAMRRLILRMRLAQLQGNMRRINYRHILEIEDMLFNRPTNSIVHLPKGVFARKTKTALIISRKKTLINS